MNNILLSDICSPKQWKTISSKNLVDKGYPIYGANGKIGFYSSYTHENPTILITCRGATCGTINISEPKSYVNGNAMALDNLSEKVDINYLKHILIARGLNDVITGSAQPQITRTNLNKIKIPLPPLKTQKRIAQILDDSTALKDKTAQILKEYDLLTQSIFLDMFGDPAINKNNFPLRTLKEFYSSEKEGTKCGPFGSALKKEEYVKEGIPVWNMDNISKNGEFINDIRLWIMEDKYLKLSSYSVIDDDIIISRAGTVGKMCVVKSEFKKSIISTNLIRLRLDKKQLLPLFFSLMMNYFKEKIGRLKTGSEGAFTHMNTGILNNLKFPYPSIELQNQFAEKIALIEQQKELAKQELKESEDLFNCLLQKAFKGELV
jgi:type I restriction enzyme S subunit